MTEQIDQEQARSIYHKLSQAIHPVALTYESVQSLIEHWIRLRDDTRAPLNAEIQSLGRIPGAWVEQMDHLLTTRVRQCLHMQIGLNDRLAGPDWKQQMRPDGPMKASLAGRVEIAEYVMSTDSYKWWAKSSVEASACRNMAMEAVDAFHFLMSADIARVYQQLTHLGTKKTSENAVVEELLASYKAVLPNILSSTVKSLVAEQTTAFNEAAEECMARFGFASLMRLVLVTPTLSLQEFFATYIVKNTLNAFRKAHGYKEGTYIKMWPTRLFEERLQRLFQPVDINGCIEDNQAAMSLMIEFSTEDALVKELERLYQLVEGDEALED